MSKLGEYLKETKAELKHVSWPTRNQAILFTVIVVVFSLVVSLFLGKNKGENSTQKIFEFQITSLLRSICIITTFKS